MHRVRKLKEIDAISRFARKYFKDKETSPKIEHAWTRVGVGVGEQILHDVTLTNINRLSKTYTQKSIKTKIYFSFWAKPIE